MRTRNGLLALGAAAFVGIGLLGLAGCAAAQDTTAASSPAATDAASGAPQGGGAGGTSRGGLTGEIVQLGSGYVLVQGDDEQTTVAYDDSTTVTQTVAGTLADVAVGACVSAFGATTDGGAATSVRVTQPVDGDCTTGFGGMGGGAGGGQGGALPSGVPTDGTMPDGGSRPAGGELPSGTPTDLPDGAASGAPGGFGGAAGEVTAVDGDVITLSATGQDGTATTSTVTVDDATAYTVEQAADAAAIATGLCVTATGTADTSGGYQATALALSAKGDEGCSSFGGRGGFGGTRTGTGSGAGLAS